MAETLTVDNTPETEVVGQLSAEEQDSLAVGEKLAAEEAQLLAGKFKDAEELEKAYIELQGKLGQPKDEAAENSEELEIEPEGEKEETEEPDSDFLDRLWDEAQSEFTTETIQELEKMDPKDLAKMHLDYRSQQPQINDSQVKQLKDIAGGEDGYKGMIEWAQGNLQKGEIDMYDTVMEKGDPLACYFAVQALKYRFDDSNGVEGKMITGKAPSTKGDQFKSQAQVIEAMNDPRYEKDPAYRKEVADKLERSDVKF